MRTAVVNTRMNSSRRQWDCWQAGAGHSTRLPRSGDSGGADLAAENARLRRENERLRMEREILKKRCASSRSHGNEIPLDRVLPLIVQIKSWLRLFRRSGRCWYGRLTQTWHCFRLILISMAGPQAERWAYQEDRADARAPPLLCRQAPSAPRRGANSRSRALGQSC